KVAFVATLGVLLFPALQLLARSIIFPIIGVVLLAFYYYLLPQNIEDINFSVGMRHFLLGTAFFFMIFWAPFIFRKSDNDTFWEHAQSIIFGLITAIFFSIIVYGGLAAALFAIEKLFHFDIQSVRYGQLAILIFGIFGINFFLSQIPKHPLFLEVRPYSKIKRLFAKNILAPIAIVYFIILFTYTAKILINMTWPSGTLSWIIVAFSFVAIISFLFLSPYLKKSSLTQRLIWFAIFLQTIVLGMALWIRVEEYGISYNRYLLGLFGLWLALMSLYFMLFEKAKQKWLFIFASLFIFVSQFGPYSATNITKQSQVDRLVKLIETAHPRSEELDMKRKYEISDGLAYVEDHYELKTFKKIIPSIFKKYTRAKEKQNNEEIYASQEYIYNFASYATKELGFKFVSKWDWKSYERNNGVEVETHSFYSSYNNERTLKTKGYDWLVNFNIYSYETVQSIKIDKNLSIASNKQTLKVQEQEQKRTLLTVNLNTFIKTILKNSNSNGELTQDELTYEHDNNSSRIKIMFQSLNINKNENIDSFNAKILFTIKEP
ncbi:MAG: Unknown protein, partial [uncultured Sulfurovum sp.]